MPQRCSIGRLAIADAVIRKLRAEEIEIGSLKVREPEVAGQRWPGSPTRRFAFLTGGSVSRAGIARRATEASDVALFERETYEPG